MFVIVIGSIVAITLAMVSLVYSIWRVGRPIWGQTIREAHRRWIGLLLLGSILLEADVLCHGAVQRAVVTSDSMQMLLLLSGSCACLVSAVLWIRQWR